MAIFSYDWTERASVVLELDPTSPPPMTRRQLLKSRLFLFAIAVVVVFFIIDASTYSYTTKLLQVVTEWLTSIDTFTVIALFILIGLLSQIVGLPFTMYPILVTLVMQKRVDNKIYAVAIGSVLTTIVLPIGGWLGFLLSKYILADWAAAIANRYRAINILREVFKEPTKSLHLQILIRLSPIVPYSLLNYIFGAMPIRSREFLISYFAAAAFWAVPCSYLGVLADNLTDASAGEDTDSEYSLVVTVASVLLTIAATAGVSFYVKKQINLIVEEEERRKCEAKELL